MAVGLNRSKHSARDRFYGFAELKPAHLDFDLVVITNNLVEKCVPCALIVISVRTSR